MRVLMIGSEPRHGLMFHPVRLALALRSLGCEVSVASLPGKAFSRDLPDSLRSAGIPLFEIDDLRRHGPGALLGRNRDLRRLVSGQHPDVIHCFGPVSAIQAAPPWMAGRPKVVVMIEAMGHDLVGLRARLGVRAGAFLLNAAADLVLPLCELERRRLAGVGISDSRLDVVFNPLDCAEILARGGVESECRREVLGELGLPGDTFLIGCFAHYQDRKRHDLVIEAFLPVAAAHPRAALVCAGGNRLPPAAASAARRAESTGRLRILGMLDSSRVYRFINACDCVLHLSNAETFGYSLVEPLLFGKPTLVAAVGIALELERAGVATVIPANDGWAAANGLRSVVERTMAESPGERQDRSTRTARFVREHFDVSAVARRLLSCYERVLRS